MFEIEVISTLVVGAGPSRVVLYRIVLERITHLRMSGVLYFIEVGTR